MSILISGIDIYSLILSLVTYIHDFLILPNLAHQYEGYPSCICKGRLKISQGIGRVGGYGEGVWGSAPSTKPGDWDLLDFEHDIRHLFFYFRL